MRAQEKRSISDKESPAYKRLEMRRRLAARDSEYTNAAAPITVEYRGNVRIETRGQRCIAPHITHLTHN